MIRLLSALLTLLLLTIAGFIWAQTQSSTQSGTNDGLRILFDGSGGFRLFRFDDAAGEYIPLLNPDSNTPVQLDFFSDDMTIPLTFISASSKSDRMPQGAFPGPQFKAGEIELFMYGIDMQDIDPELAVVRYDIVNKGSSIQTLTIRFIFDSFLGESSPAHFIVSDGKGGQTQVAKEYQLLVADQPQYVLSAKSGTENGMGMIVPPRRGLSRSPDKVFFANVRRAQNAGRSMDVEQGREFNLLPFSINDSAIVFYYTNVVLLPGQALPVDVVISSHPKLETEKMIAGITALQNMKPAEDANENPTATQSPTDIADQDLTKEDLVKKLNEYLAELNNLLETGNYKTAQIERLIQAIDQLQAAIGQ